MGMMNKPTKELKVAEKITEMVNDLTLDLDQVGIYLATSNRISYRRLMEIIDSAEFEKNERIHNDDYLF